MSGSAFPFRNCPLCGCADSPFMFSVDGRRMHACPQCDLLFAEYEAFLSADEEKRRYDNHRNDMRDQGYVTHLSRLKDAVLPLLAQNACGLDFGCGPVPVLAQLFELSGFRMKNYDRFYAPLLPQQANGFDFITCCETAEHFQDPAREFRLISTLVKPGGLIGIMTNLREGERRNSDWWYLRDPTHVVFYSKRTISELAKLFCWDLVSAKDDVAIFRTRKGS